MNIDNDIIELLKSGTITEGKFYLPDRKLDRSVYTSIDKILRCAGYKWNRKEKAHLPTQENSEEILKSAIQTGFILDPKKDFQFFPTPHEVVEQMIEALPFENGARILEPSAGTGNIADAIRKHCDSYRLDYQIDVCELNPQCQQVLKAKGFNVVGEDFLEFNPEKKYDLIIMNPPFNKQQDIDHVTHALSMLTDDGQLVSVMFPSFQWRDNKKSKEFRELIDNFYNPHHYGCEIRKIESGAFKESGTNISTVILFLYP